MHFYDQRQQPIDTPAQLSVGALFAIGVLEYRLNTGAAQLVGVFIEDDENYHCKAVFDAGWLSDLAQVAARAAQAVSHKQEPTLAERLDTLEAIVATLVHHLQNLPTSDHP